MANSKSTRRTSNYSAANDSQLNLWDGLPDGDLALATVIQNRRIKVDQTTIHSSKVTNTASSTQGARITPTPDSDYYEELGVQDNFMEEMSRMISAQARSTLLDLLPNVADHELEARRQCAFGFIQTVLLPRLASKKPIALGEVVGKAIDYKSAFRTQHPDDLVGEFALLEEVLNILMWDALAVAAERPSLFSADSTIGAGETSPIVRLMDEMENLFSQYGEDLAGV